MKADPSSGVEHWLAEWSAGSSDLVSCGRCTDQAMGRRARAVRGLLSCGVSVAGVAELLGVSESMVRKLLRDERG